MKYSKEYATHFLTYQDPKTGASDLVDCIPLGGSRDNTVKVIVFSEEVEVSMVCVVEAERVLSMDDVAGQIVTDVMSDMMRAILADDRRLP